MSIHWSIRRTIYRSITCFFVFAKMGENSKRWFSTYIKYFSFNWSGSICFWIFHSLSFTLFLSWVFFSLSFFQNLSSNLSFSCSLSQFFLHNLSFQPLFLNLCKTSDASLTARGLVVCLPRCQISGWYEELGAQYPHPKPYSDLVLPQLGQGGKSYPPATQRDSIRALKQPAIRAKQQFSVVRLSVK